ncbi:MAG TPA: ATP-binding protein [Desulfovibrio sp.]|uniref:two-component system sensor histidine kinase NtrB n=1 Tax=Desulfovibrio sp. TaxID=885 RepID=UPI002C7A5FA5|nr:ATP-binding protein [Desulfovibrio sp.]HMM37465.1 ATP-binding protein [Desulfovibrio sp.]
MPSPAPPIQASTPLPPRLLVVTREAADLKFVEEALAGLHLAPEAVSTVPGGQEAGETPWRAAVIFSSTDDEPLKQARAARALPGGPPVLLLTPEGWSAQGRVFSCRCAYLPRSVDATELRRILLDLLEEPGRGDCGARRFFRSLVEFLGGVMVLASADDLRILEWPRGAEVLFGVSRDQALGRPFPELLEPLLGAAGGLAGLPKDGRGLLHEEVSMPRPDGPPIQLLRSVYADVLGGARVLALFFYDVSERRKRDRLMGIAQRLESIGRLASGIAHEINTPIHYIGDNIRFLEQSFAGMDGVLRLFLACLAGVRRGEDPAPHLERIEEAIAAADLDFLESEIPLAISQSMEGVERVAAIVRGMKKFAHPEQEERRHVDLNQALRDALLVARNEWKYVAEVVTDFDEGLPLVSCLAGDLNQVFLNIIVNAAQAVEESARGRGGKGRITVSTRRDGDFVEILVADTGVGIAKRDQSRVFDPFFTTKEVGRGTGQGLAIAHSIVVDKHGGTITFTSEEGRGTRFFIRLPLTPRPEVRRP